MAGVGSVTTGVNHIEKRKSCAAVHIKMNSKIPTGFVCLVAVFSVASSAATKSANEEIKLSQEDLKKYIAIMESVNVEQVVNNERLLNTHLKCFINEGPCVPQFKDLKKVLPALVKDNCSLCTDSQKELAKKVREQIKTKHPKEFEKFVKLYDPDGVLSKQR
ncbi:putative odorant-binding protein A10 [Adelges cooleyi]|uniref:putative odorant-binding protein A10 n=1 Tax=Adelges cooleyi TaxID=133065 RepID=UPI00218090E4|nr:putative odorant-binding protein A10 [Adelges cooleyi]